MDLLGWSPRAKTSAPATAGERDLTVDLPPGDPIAGPVRLWVETGTLGPRAFEVRLAAGTEITLGSAGPDEQPLDAFVRIDDPTVSACHCRVTHTGHAIEVLDLGSRNGLRLSGLRVPRAVLPLGGAFEIGRTMVRVQPPDTAVPQQAPLAGLVGGSAVMRSLASAVRRMAPLRLPALLRGESGTGKDLVARSVHNESRRAGGPFVVINAAAISRELAESELFGHQRGAFTGAFRDRRGAFREAHGGTLFLDEIGAVPLELQAKLLRVVEEGVVRPLGSEMASPVDVRLIAATCEPLEVMVAQRRFRGDLYERLAVCVVHVPALRERPEDIPALARHLLDASGLPRHALSHDALTALRAHRWPGNVRELRNVLVQAAVNADVVIRAEHVAAVLAERAGRARKLDPYQAMRIFEETGGNVSEAARRADLPRTTMRDLLRTAGIRGRSGRHG
jgi:DNA-binding NtrC family response regulator